MRYVIYFADSPIPASLGAPGTAGSVSPAGNQSGNQSSPRADMNKPDPAEDNSADQTTQQDVQMKKWEKNQAKQNKSLENSRDKLKNGISGIGKEYAAEEKRELKNKGKYATGNLVREADADIARAAESSARADQLVKESAVSPAARSAEINMSRRLGRWL